MASFSEKFAERLNEVLMVAPDAEVDALVASLKEFRDTAPRSYQALKRQPFAGAVIEAVEEYQAFMAEMAS